MIIDSHVHIFPYLGDASGWESVSAHLAALQWLFGATRPASTTGSANEVTLSSKLPDVNCRIGKFGRFEWTEDGVDYYRQVMPPSLQDQASTPEFILAQMEYAGIDMAVLQNAKVYGKLNEYFAECVRRYPTRFVGLAEINELEADKESEISKLRYCIKELGLKGIYYEATRFFEIGQLGGFNDKKFDLFWREVNDLGIAVFWILIIGRISPRTHMDQMKAFSDWADRFPDIPSVVVMGLFEFPFIDNDEIKIPKELLNIFKKPNVYAEIIHPITAGRLGWDSPYPQTRPSIKQQYEELGPHKLVWGSDMPNVERNCTYRQSLTYLKDYCDFIKPKDMDLILGGNIARILKIPTDIPTTLLGPKLAPMT